MPVVHINENGLDSSGSAPHLSYTCEMDTVLFAHAAWCGYCKQAMPEYLQASIQLAGTVTFLAIEDVMLKKLPPGNPISSHISGFPTFFHCKAGSSELKPINLPRNKQGMVDFLGSAP